jgi:hypothetical protein
VLHELICELLTALSCQLVLPLGPVDALYEVTLKAVGPTATSCNLSTYDIVTEVSGCDMGVTRVLQTLSVNN